MRTTLAVVKHQLIIQDHYPQKREGAEAGGKKEERIEYLKIAWKRIVRLRLVLHDDGACL